MEYYDEAYFASQRAAGEFGGKAELYKFQPFIHEDDSVVDFGCGGGYLLANLKAGRKLGIEINESARNAAKRLGIETVARSQDVPDEIADVIISNHALEHVAGPFDALVGLRAKLKPGGRAVFVVPHQGPRQGYLEDDPHMHLYTWNPTTLGNLFKAAGYRVEQVDVLRHKWPPRYLQLRKLLGQAGFDLLCRLRAVDGR